MHFHIDSSITKKLLSRFNSRFKSLKKKGQVKDQNSKCLLLKEKTLFFLLFNDLWNDKVKIALNNDFDCSRFIKTKSFSHFSTFFNFLGFFLLFKNHSPFFSKLKNQNQNQNDYFSLL